MAKDKDTAGPPRRGFASMSAAKQRAIASKGGKSVPSEKRSFSQSRELAVQSGRLGGLNVPAEKRIFSRDPELAARLGRIGGSRKRSGKRE